MPITAPLRFAISIGESRIQLGVTSVLFRTDALARQLVSAAQHQRSETAKFLDDQHLEPGTVLMDTTSIHGNLAQVEQSRQFIADQRLRLHRKLKTARGSRGEIHRRDGPDNYNADAVQSGIQDLGNRRRESHIPVLSVADAKGYDAYRIFQVVKPPSALGLILLPARCSFDREFQRNCINIRLNSPDNA